MPANPKTNRSGASNSFTRDEVVAGVQLFDTIARGGDVRVLARSAAVRSLHAKFRRMQLSVAEGRSGIDQNDSGDGAA